MTWEKISDIRQAIKECSGKIEQLRGYL